MASCIKNFCGNPGRSAHPLGIAAAEAVYNARKEVSSFFGSKKPENVIFTQNATHALNLAIFGIVRRGDHILISNLEHNSVLRPVAELYRRGAAYYSVFDALGTDEEIIGNIKRALRKNTRVIITTHCSNVCPKKLPIEKISELCREKGIYHIVDIAQSAGIYDISVKNGASVLCAPGHKGLYGPQGSGFCLFADDFDFRILHPHVFGGNGINSANADMGTLPPEAFEAGTLAVPNIVGLHQGIRFVKSVGVSAIRAHESAVSAAIKERLATDKRIKLYLPEAEDSSLLLFSADGISASALAKRLADKGVCVRAGMHCSPLAHKALGTGGDAVRLSFGVFNTFTEAITFCSILDECLK
jgi:selenocysteine lyase/cysteine desulfurase